MKEAPTPEQYEQARYRLIAGFAPPTYACKKCAWPVIRGYCCNHCGDNNPSEAPAGSGMGEAS